MEGTPMTPPDAMSTAYTARCRAEDRSAVTTLALAVVGVLAAWAGAVVAVTL